jgi:hypothetical protein
MYYYFMYYYMLLYAREPQYPNIGLSTQSAGNRRTEARSASDSGSISLVPLHSDFDQFGNDANPRKSTI